MLAQHDNAEYHRDDRLANQHHRYRCLQGSCPESPLLQGRHNDGQRDKHVRRGDGQQALPAPDGEPMRTDFGQHGDHAQPDCHGRP